MKEDMNMTLLFARLIDVLLVAVFLFFVLLFLKFGFAKAVYKIGKSWISIVCSLILGPLVAGKVRDVFLDKFITDGLYSGLKIYIDQNANGYNLHQLFNNLPDGFVKFIGSYNVDIGLLEAEFGAIEHPSSEIVMVIAQRLAAPCISMLSGIIGYLVCFFVPLIFFTWLNLKIRRCRRPFFRHVDRVSGLFVGIAIGFCASVALSILIQTIFQVTLAFDMKSSVADIYKDSIIFDFLTKIDMSSAIRNLLGK